jgi:N6-L-threonylcarbamoyladenine synthase
MRILGIETSCDETAAAVVEKTASSDAVVLSSVVASSQSFHAKTGGVIPETAAREQLRYIMPVIHDAILSAKLDITNPDFDAIAVTYGPGLIGSLLIGVETTKTLSYLWKKPIIPVNHMVGHIYANWLTESASESIAIPLPAVALVVSGGHTDLLFIQEHGKYEVLGGTRDDAAGEAFDKIGRLLGLAYPAGPEIARYASDGNPTVFSLPRPMLDSGDFDFSFSGLKTAVLNLLKKDPDLATKGVSDPQTKADICAAVQEAIVEVLVRKTLQAVKEKHALSLLLGGGVAANTHLRQKMQEAIKKTNLTTKLCVPQARYCTDNAAMIAAAALYDAKESTHWMELNANPELYY